MLTLCSPFSESVQFLSAHYLIAPAFRADRTEAILLAASKYDNSGGNVLV